LSSFLDLIAVILDLTLLILGFRRSFLDLMAANLGLKEVSLDFKLSFLDLASGFCRLLSGAGRELSGAGDLFPEGSHCPLAILDLICVGCAVRTTGAPRAHSAPYAEENDVGGAKYLSRILDLFRCRPGNETTGKGLGGSFFPSLAFLDRLP
jgi:hypothetical protein